MDIKSQGGLINTSLDVRGAARLNPLSSPTNNPNKRSNLQSQPKQTKTGSASEVVEGRFANKFTKGRKHKWTGGGGQAAQLNNTCKEFSPQSGQETILDHHIPEKDEEDERMGSGTDAPERASRELSGPPDGPFNKNGRVHGGGGRGTAGDPRLNLSGQYPDKLAKIKIRSGKTGLQSDNEPSLVQHTEAVPEDAATENISTLFEGLQNNIPPDSADTTAINAKGRVKVINATAATKDCLFDGKMAMNDQLFIADHCNNGLRTNTGSQNSQTHFLAQSAISDEPCNATAQPRYREDNNDHHYYPNLDGLNRNPKYMKTSSSNTSRGHQNKVYGYQQNA